MIPISRNNCSSDCFASSSIQEADGGGDRERFGALCCRQLDGLLVLKLGAAVLACLLSLGARLIPTLAIDPSGGSHNGDATNRGDCDEAAGKVHAHLVGPSLGELEFTVLRAGAKMTTRVRFP